MGLTRVNNLWGFSPKNIILFGAESILECWNTGIILFKNMNHETKDFTK